MDFRWRCLKGNWIINAHDRAFLKPDNHNLVIEATKLGINGEYQQVALPKSMAPYRSGHLYFHGGISLQEALVPVLSVELKNNETVVTDNFNIELIYKRGAKKITTRVPVIELVAETEDMFTKEMNIEVIVEAEDREGRVIGEPNPGGEVNPATGTITLRPGESKNITMKMEPDFEGKFKIKAINPKTEALYARLDLETDYAV